MFGTDNNLNEEIHFSRKVIQTVGLEIEYPVCKDQLLYNLLRDLDLVNIILIGLIINVTISIKAKYCMIVNIDKF